MPRFDGTGPMGQGAQTGKRQGRCNNTDTNDSSTVTEQGVRRGFRMRFQSNEQDFRGRGYQGQGRGMGNGMRQFRNKNNQ